MRTQALKMNKCPCCKKKLEDDREKDRMIASLEKFMSDSSPLAKMDDETKLAKENPGIKVIGIAKVADLVKYLFG